MPEQDKKPLSAEEMACLVDGLGTDAQLSEWEARLVHNPEMREEYVELKKMTKDNCGIVEDYAVDKYMEEFFPESKWKGILIQLKAGALELLQAPGWRPAFQEYRDRSAAREAAQPTTGIVNLNQKFDNLVVDVQVVRVEKDELEVNVIVKDKLVAGTPRIEVSLLKNQRLLHSKFLEANRAQFTEVRPGEYAVQLTRAQKGLLSFELKIAF